MANDSSGSPGSGFLLCVWRVNTFLLLSLKSWSHHYYTFFSLFLEFVVGEGGCEYLPAQMSSWSCDWTRVNQIINLLIPLLFSRSAHGIFLNRCLPLFEEFLSLLHQCAAWERRQAHVPNALWSVRGLSTEFFKGGLLNSVLISSHNYLKSRGKCYIYLLF